MSLTVVFVRPAYTVITTVTDSRCSDTTTCAMTLVVLLVFMTWQSRRGVRGGLVDLVTLSQET